MRTHAYGQYICIKYKKQSYSNYCKLLATNTVTSYYYPMKQVRQTESKQRVMQILKESSIPLSLQAIFETAKQTLPSVAFSTVYRIVQILESTEQVIRVDWRERGSAYEWAGRPHHHHIVCENCDTLADIDDATLSFCPETVSNATGFTIKHHSIELTGICPPCQQKGTV